MPCVGTWRHSIHTGARAPWQGSAARGTRRVTAPRTAASGTRPSRRPCSPLSSPRLFHHLPSTVAAASGPTALKSAEPRLGASGFRRCLPSPYCRPKQEPGEGLHKPPAATLAGTPAWDRKPHRPEPVLDRRSSSCCRVRQKKSVEVPCSRLPNPPPLE